MDPGVPKNAIGVHLFHITPVSYRQKESQVIISIDNGRGDAKQFGPDLSTDDRLSIATMLDPTRHEPPHEIRAHHDNVCWFMLDIMRLTSDIKEIPKLHALKDHKALFPIHKYYDDTPQNRQQSAHIAHCHARLSSCLPPHEPISYYTLSIAGPQHLITSYSKSLPLIRGKWLEIQSETQELYNYTLEVTPTSTNNTDQISGETHANIPYQNNDPNPSLTTRFTMTLNAWPTHMVMGTELEIDLVGREDPIIPTRVTINKKRVNFVLDEGKLTPEDVAGGRICRSNERMSSITDILCTGRAILTKDTQMKTKDKQANSSRILSGMLGIPCQTPGPTHASNLQLALQYRAQIPREMSRSKWPRQKVILKAQRLRNLANVSRDLKTSTFTTLNEIQTRCVTSAKEVMSCRGYPGTGKTKTLAAYVLKRLEYNLSLPCGWILCLTNSNVSACAIMDHLITYPSIATVGHGHKGTHLVHHAYSPLYAAFHPDDFTKSYPYRLTPKAKLGTHGILVCTIGKFSHVIRKYPLLAKRTFDLVFDEVGQVWYLTGLAVCAKLPHIKRLGMFGDDKQLPPYVTKLAGLADIQPSVMTPFIHGTDANRACTHELHKLDTQYRMIPVICKAHSPLFYEYPIITGRAPPPNPQYDGAFVDVLEPTRQRGQSSYIEASCRRAFDLLHRIHGLHLCQSDGKPYTYRIITPYVEVLERLLKLRSSLPSSSPNVIIRTIDTSQGSEANVVIVVTGKTTVSDLNGCPYRGNVALSRAKDILVVIGTSKFFADHPPNLRSMYHWGKWVLAKGMKSVAMSQTELHSLCLSIRHKTLHREMLQSHVPSPSYKRAIAMTIQQTPLDQRPDRKSIAKALALKRKYSMNKDIHKNLYGLYLHCSQEQLEMVLQLHVDIVEDIDRNRKLSAHFNFDRFQRVDAKTDDLVRAAYPTDQRSDNNRQGGRNRRDRYPMENARSNERMSRHHHQRRRH